MGILSSLTAAIVIGTSLLTGCTNPLATQYFKQGVEKYEAGNYQGAISDYTKAVEIDPLHTNSYINRSKAKLNLGDNKGALQDSNKAIEIDPSSSLAYMNRGISRELVNDLEGACDDWRKAVDLGKERPAKWVKQQC